MDGGARSLASVAPALPVKDFLRWLTTPNKPAWIPDNDWNQLNVFVQNNLIENILNEISTHQVRWDAWINSINANNRQEVAVMDEWLVIREGGREVFTNRDHYIYDQPTTMGTYQGTALSGQVMRWTGEAATKIENQKERIFYAVEFFRTSKSMKGWFRGDLLAEYVYSAPENDPEIEKNSQTVFDLSKQILRHPQDP